MVSLNDKFQSLFLDEEDIRYYVITGGRGGGKSFSVMTWLAIRDAFEAHHTTLLTRYTMKAADISVIPELTSKLPSLGLENEFATTKNDVVHEANNNRVLFRGIKTSSGDQTANLKSIEGLDTWIVDEAEELVDEATFDTIDFSVRQKGTHNKVILILNPPTKEHWIYKRFFAGAGVPEGFNGRKGDVRYIHTTYLDNLENLDHSFIRKAEELKIKNPVKWGRVFGGKWQSKAEGVIFPDWEYGNFPTQLPAIYGQDYGFSNDPTTLVKMAVDTSALKVYVEELLYKPELSTKAIYDVNLAHAGNTGLIVGDSAEPRLLKELRQMGLNIKPAEKGPDSVRAGIKALQDYTIVVCGESPNLVLELDHYRWNDKRSGTPEDKNNHLIDAIRYAFRQLVGKPNRGKYYVK